LIEEVHCLYLRPVAGSLSPKQEPPDDDMEKKKTFFGKLKDRTKTKHPPEIQ
jgi:hypothetical protein